MKKYEIEIDEALRATLPKEQRIALQPMACLHEAEGRSVYLVKLPGEKAQAVLKQSKVGRLDAEFDTLQALSQCPEISLPAPMAYWEEDGTEYLLREHIRGLTLRQWREEKTEVSPQELKTLGLKVCRILAALHARGLVARDIKPENFVLSDGGALYLIDVDTLRAFDQTKSLDTQTLGTPGFAAPEQYGFRQTDSRSDVYGFGQMMHYLSTGSTDPQKQPDKPMPRQIKRMIAQCTAFDPDNRYKDMEQVEKALLSRPRRPMLMLALLLVIACLAGLLLWPHTADDEIIASSFSSLQAAVDSIPIYGSGVIRIDQEFKLNQQLLIQQRKVTFSGTGTIKSGNEFSADALPGIGLIVITSDAQLTLTQGVTVRNQAACPAIDCAGVFVLDGGLVSTWAANGGSLVLNTGIVRMNAGELNLSTRTNASNNWPVDNYGLWQMDGGLMLLTDVSWAMLNRGEGRFNAGAIKLYPSSGQTGGCVNDFEQGYSIKNGTVFMINDRREN